MIRVKAFVSTMEPSMTHYTSLSSVRVRVRISINFEVSVRARLCFGLKVRVNNRAIYEPLNIIVARIILLIRPSFRVRVQL
jgi:hypothetical protein